MKGERRRRGPELRWVAAAAATVLAIVALAAVLYRLIDVILILFLGVILSAALQPLHTTLCQRGMRRGTAVLLVYCYFVGSLAVLILLLGPTLVEQLTTIAAEL